MRSPPGADAEINPSSPSLLQLTHNEANFTVMIVVAAGHHGPDGVIHHGHDVNVEVLRWWRGEKLSQRGQNRPEHLLLSRCGAASRAREPCAPGPPPRPAQPLTPLFLMDLRSIDTTSFPSTLLHLNPFVHVTRMLYRETARRDAGGGTHKGSPLPARSLVHSEGWRDTQRGRESVLLSACDYFRASVQIKFMAMK